DNRKDPAFIVTIPGRGYSFVGHLNNGSDLVVESHRISRILVEEGVAGNSDNAGEKALLVSDAPRSRSRRNFIILAIAGLLLLITGGFIAQRWRMSASSVPFQQMSMRRLTTTGLVGNTAISPDGKLFVYAEHNGDEESLWLGHIDGGEPVQLRP